MPLTNFIESCDQDTIVKRENVMLIDGHNLLYRTLYVANYNCPEDTQFVYWKYLLVNSLLSSIKHFKPTKVVFAIDETHHWRKRIYSGYKERRKEARDKSTVDFKKFYPIADKFLTELQNTLTNIMFLKVPECEGDDIIAILSKYIFQKDDILIISTDKDMVQLLDNKKVKLFDPIGKKYRKSINPKKELDIKILMGDKSDDIPPVKPKVGIKTAAKIYNLGIEEFLGEKKEYAKAFKRNSQLIDFNLIPVDIRKRIEKAYSSYRLLPYNGAKVWQFFIKNRIKKFADDLQMYSPSLKDVK